MARFWGGFDEFPSYVSAVERRERAVLAAKRLARQSKRSLAPVVLAGRKITTTFWGKAWCENLESYADFAYRLDRGRSYVRQGAVIDLRIDAARVQSHVSGTDLYDVDVRIQPLKAARWKKLVAGCGDRIDSVVSLLQGRLPDERDAGGAPPVMVINRTMARHYWPGEDPIGRRVRILGAVTRAHADLLRAADAIFIDELRNARNGCGRVMIRVFPWARRTGRKLGFRLRFGKQARPGSRP
jgi:hypothetical protein